MKNGYNLTRFILDHETLFVIAPGQDPIGCVLIGRVDAKMAETLQRKVGTYPVVLRLNNFHQKPPALSLVSHDEWENMRDNLPFVESAWLP